MRFAALGRTKMLLNSISACIERGHECVLIGTSEQSPEAGVTARDFADLARDLGCPFLIGPRLDTAEARQAIPAMGAPVAISVNWQTIIPGGVIDLFDRGIINFHIGDLPRFRGNATANWAILAGETRVALTLHFMDRELDAGPVLAKEYVELTPATRIGDVYGVAEERCPVMFADCLDALERGSQGSDPQPPGAEGTLRCYPRLPRDSQIDWAQRPELIVRLVNAVSEPFAGAYTFLENRRMIIWRARVEAVEWPYLAAPGQVMAIRRNGEVLVSASGGAVVLEVVELDQGRVPAAQAIRSVRTRLGMDVTAEVYRLLERVQHLEDKLRP